MRKDRVLTQSFASLLRLYVGPGRRMTVAECAAKTGFAERTIETWLYGECEPRAFGLKCLADVLGQGFWTALSREWGFLVEEAPADEMTREIGALLATAGYRVVKARAA